MALKKDFYYHLLFWIILFAGWHFFRYQDYKTEVSWLVTFIKVADLAILVYITNYLLVPKLLYRKKYFQFIIVLLLMIILSSAIKLYVIGKLMGMQNIFNLQANLKGRIYDNVLPHILLVCTGLAFKLMHDQLQSQRRLANLAKEKAESELNFLRSQVNPHFVFNTLNSIYFLIDRENKDARSALLQFSDMLRYQLYDGAMDSIPIEKEIAFIKEYVHLQKIRKDNNFEVIPNIDETVKGFSIKPLFIIPFVENAFKHISHFSSQKNFINIYMNYVNGIFEFGIRNSTEKGSEINRASGIGLKNVKRRLELLYPEKHSLEIVEATNEFKVILKLEIEN